MKHRCTGIAVVSVALALVVAGTSIAEETCGMRGVWYLWYVLTDEDEDEISYFAEGWLVVYQDVGANRFVLVTNAPLEDGFDKIVTGNVDLAEGPFTTAEFTPKSPAPFDMTFDRTGGACSGYVYLYFGDKNFYRFRAIRIDEPHPEADWSSGEYWAE